MTGVVKTAFTTSESDYGSMDLQSDHTALIQEKVECIFDRISKMM